MSQLLTQNGSESESGFIQASDTKKSIVQQLIVFRLGGEEYGLAIEQVKEIVVTPPIARIPLMPTYVKGVANVRGSILAIIDLAEKFGLHGQQSALEEEAVKSFILVMESDTLKMGILVREVPSTLSVTQDQIESSPSLVHDSNGDNQSIKGIIRVGARLIILIDVYKIISKEILQKVSS
jgi:purine-binding chemotaxis protein CheW